MDNKKIIGSNKITIDQKNIMIFGLSCAHVTKSNKDQNTKKRHRSTKIFPDIYCLTLENKKKISGKHISTGSR